MPDLATTRRKGGFQPRPSSSSVPRCWSSMKALTRSSGPPIKASSTLHVR